MTWTLGTGHGHGRGTLILFVIYPAIAVANKRGMPGLIDTTSSLTPGIARLPVDRI